MASAGACLHSGCLERSAKEACPCLVSVAKREIHFRNFWVAVFIMWVGGDSVFLRFYHHYSEVLGAITASCSGKPYHIEELDGNELTR